MLTVLLNNHPDIFSGGELCEFPSLYLKPDGLCSCGEQLRSCEFWNDVQRTFERKAPDFDVQEFASLVNLFERWRYAPGHIMSWPGGVRRAARRYRRYVKLQYEAIAECSGKEVLVDSSKNPMRAHLLADDEGTEGIRPYFVHMIRDPRAVVRSHNRFQKGLIKPSVMWALTNVASEYATRRRRPETLRMTYEDFCADPLSYMDRLAAAIALDPDPLRDVLTGDRLLLNQGHLIAGNRLRHRGTMKLEVDTAWKTSLSRKRQKLCWALSGVVARRYGYRP